MTLLAFLVALGLLISVHEWAHYRVAVACGVRVLRFSIGFGPALLRWKSRRPHPGQDTEFVIGAIPLGGYVRMLDASDGALSAEQLPFSFERQPLLARSLIVAAGPLANLGLAVLLYGAVFFHGELQTQAVMATPVAGSPAQLAGVKSGDQILRAGWQADQLQDVLSLEEWRDSLRLGPEAPTQLWLEVQSQGVSGKRLLTLDLPAAGADRWPLSLADLGLQGAWSPAVIGDMQPGQPAFIAGLQRGDRVLRIDQRWIDDAAMLRQTVRASGTHAVPQPQRWEIQRHGAGVIELEVTPARVLEGAHYIGRIGAQVGEPPQTTWIEWTLGDSLVLAVKKTWDMSALTCTTIARMLTGQASLDQLSGPLTMADYAGRSAQLGFSAYLGYLALLSVSLGVFNLLPLPLLDGGHLMYYLYEACTGRPPSPIWLERLQRLGLAVLMALMAVSFFNDVVRLGWLS